MARNALGHPEMGGIEDVGAFRYLDLCRVRRALSGSCCGLIIRIELGVPPTNNDGIVAIPFRWGMAPQFPGTHVDLPSLGL